MKLNGSLRGGGVRAPLLQNNISFSSVQDSIYIKDIKKRYNRDEKITLSSSRFMIFRIGNFAFLSCLTASGSKLLNRLWQLSKKF